MKLREFFDKSDIYRVVITLFCTFLFLHFVAQKTVVEGHSMEGSLNDGDNLIVEKVQYHFADPERFDIVVFKYKEGNEIKYLIKRVIGLPGETVFIDDNGSIFINGNILEENYGKEPICNPGIASQEIVIGEDEYFVLGDNRNHSKDSRSKDIGLVDKSIIIGKARVRIFPFSDFGQIDR